MKNKKFFSKSIIALWAILLMFGANSFAIKHVLYMDNVVNTTQHFCISVPLPSDTFVVYTPSVFVGGGTWWKVNGSGYAYNQDSIVYIPGAVASFDISAISYAFGFEQMFILQLYSTPPAHAQFELPWGGGSINATNDTVWMCSNSVTVADNTSTLECTYWQWTGPSFSSTTSPVTISAPGTYIFERGNPCGVTRDTFEVVQPPYTLPNLGADITLCNDPTSVNLDAGSGWTSYLWNTGEATQMILVDTSGTYTVTVTSPCITGSASRIIHYESYPLPVISASATTACTGSTITVYLNSTYDSYEWSDYTTADTMVVSETGQYNCFISQGACWATSNTLGFTFQHVNDSNVICIATVDAQTGHNKVVWEPTQNVGTVSYNIYKLNGTYLQIGNVLHDNSPSLVFNDMVSNPMSSSVRYKIAAVDSCGNTSTLGFGVGTIKINSNPGTGGGVDLTIADPYWDESGIYIPSKYYILIDSLNNGSLHIIDSIDAVFNSYTVVSPFTGATYVVGVAFPWACGGSKTSFSQMSFSNKSDVVTGIHANATQEVSVSIFPNPSTGIFTVQGDGVLKVDVSDLLGRIILTINQKTFNLGQYGGGVYNVHISTKDGSTDCKVIVIQ